MNRESRTVDRSHQVDSSTPRHLPLVDLLVDTRPELMELAVASGLKVLQTMLEDDRTAICGQRYQHQNDRQASRAGTVSSEVVLGGRKVPCRLQAQFRPRDGLGNIDKMPSGLWPGDIHACRLRRTNNQ